MNEELILVFPTMEYEIQAKELIKENKERGINYGINCRNCWVTECWEINFI